MYALRNSYARFSRIACFVFAVQFFNLSIDPKDREPGFVPEDLSINEIESFAELLAEVVLGFDNTFEEHDESDEERAIDFCKIFFVSQSSLHIVSNSFSLVITKYFVDNSKNFWWLTKEITSPPPEA